MTNLSMGMGIPQRTSSQPTNPPTLLNDIPTPLPPHEPQADTPKGLITPGTIDLYNRPTVHNKDGTISTVRSIVVEAGGKHIVIPTVMPDGTIASPDEAFKHLQKTKQHLGMFKTQADAVAYAETLHEQQAKLYPH